MINFWTAMNILGKILTAINFQDRIHSQFLKGQSSLRFNWSNFLYGWYLFKIEKRKIFNWILKRPTLTKNCTQTREKEDHRYHRTNHSSSKNKIFPYAIFFLLWSRMISAFVIVINNKVEIVKESYYIVQHYQRWNHDVTLKNVLVLYLSKTRNYPQSILPSPSKSASSIIFWTSTLARETVSECIKFSISCLFNLPSLSTSNFQNYLRRNLSFFVMVASRKLAMNSVQSTWPLLSKSIAMKICSMSFGFKLALTYFLKYSKPIIISSREIIPLPFTSSLTNIFLRSSISFYEICTAKYIRIVFLRLKQIQVYSFMVTNFLRPLKTYQGRFKSSVVLLISLFTQGWSYALRAVYLLLGSLTNNLAIRSLAQLLHLWKGSRSSVQIPFLILIKIDVTSLPQKGGLPQSKIYKITPHAQLSTYLPYLPLITSGARYIVVPLGWFQNYFYLKILAIPKSINLILWMLSFSLRRMFSGFKSLWQMLW